MEKKAMIAMSGGVDSSVAAYLMKEQGYETVGVTLRLFANEDIGLDQKKTCCSIDDVADARSVAFALDIPFYVFNFGENFKEHVMQRFADGYLSGQTPNPCIDCNRYIKFNHLLSRAESMGFDYVVTGHYVRVGQDTETGRYLLKKGLDTTKDQSYVLYSLTQEQLSKTLFPVGELTKKQVREIAQNLEFVNSDKPDSQDICFVKDGDYRSFLETWCGRPFEAGDFLDMEGNVLGTHNGTIGYTIGQRKGLGVSAPHPLYVVKKDMVHNTVTLGENKDLFRTGLTAGDLNWISVAGLDAPLKADAKIRYKHQEAPCTVFPQEDGTVRVEFEEPQRAVTSGQAVVFYDGDIVIGGGTILE